MTYGKIFGPSYTQVGRSYDLLAYTIYVPNKNVQVVEMKGVGENSSSSIVVGLGGIAVFSHGTIKEIIPSNAGNTAINCACAMHRVPAVFYRFLVMASGQQLTEKCGTKSAVWKYFGLIADDSGGGSQQDNPVCRICGVQVRAATGNTSNLLSHLKNKHPKVHSKARLLMKREGEKRSGTTNINQPTLSSVLYAVQPYERGGRRWLELTDS